MTITIPDMREWPAWYVALILAVVWYLPMIPFTRWASRNLGTGRWDDWDGLGFWFFSPIVLPVGSILLVLDQFAKLLIAERRQ